MSTQGSLAGRISAGRWLGWMFVAVCMSACGGSEPSAKSPEFELPLKSTVAERCLRGANVKRARSDDEPAKITVRHVLVKYAGAKRADASITRSREQACVRAAEAYRKLTEGAEFDKIVKAYSDEAGAATRGGSLGAVERHDVAPPFADAAFELDFNQVSEVVESEFGFHIIMRTE